MMNKNEEGPPDVGEAKQLVEDDEVTDKSDVLLGSSAGQRRKQPNANTTSNSSSTKRSFDRLLPRKRTLPLELCSTSSSSVEDRPDDGSKKMKKCSYKKEYAVLKTLVPALAERDDLSRMEIVEETIRYIDALHHQLAARHLPSPLVPESLLGDQIPSNSPGTSQATPPTPLRSRISTSSSSILASTGPSVPSTSVLDSPQDMKAAVENIQAMFAAYLEDNSDHSLSQDNH